MMKSSHFSKYIVLVTLCLFAITLCNNPRQQHQEAKSTDHSRGSIHDNYEGCKRVLKVIHTIDRLNSKSLKIQEKINLLGSLTLNIGFCVKVVEYLQNKHEKTRDIGDCKSGLTIIIKDVHGLFIEQEKLQHQVVEMSEHKVKFFKGLAEKSIEICDKIDF